MLAQEAPGEGRHLTAAEAASRVGIAVRTMYDYMRNGAIPAERHGTCWLVRESELEAWLAGPAVRAQRCEALRPDGSRCRTWALKGSPHCQWHGPAPSRVARRCGATRPNGEPCRATALTGGRVCWWHRQGEEADADL